MPMDIPEWRNVDRHLFETQILPAGRPAVFKGVVDNWPLMQRRTDQRLSFPLKAVLFPVYDVRYRKSRTLANNNGNSRANILG
jgi:hypothetical protein